MQQAWPLATWKYAKSNFVFLVLLVAVGCKKDASTNAPAANTRPNDVVVNEPTSSASSATSGSVEKDAEQPEPPAKSDDPPAKADDPPAGQPSKNPGASEPKSTETKKHRDELFKDWRKPKFVLLFTGQQMGYLEPCGCTGLTNQKGGLARRHTLFRQLTERGWPIVAADVGNQIHRFGRQSEIKFQITADALKKIGYQAIALGVDDLRLSAGELAAVTLANDGGTTPFMSANAAVYDRELTPTHHIVEAAGKKIGITAILGSELQSKIIGSDVILTTPEAGLDAVMPKLKEAKCDVLVLLAHASEEDSKKLAEKYRDFHVIVSAGIGAGEPDYQPETIGSSKTVFIKVGAKGMYLTVLGFYDDPKTPWRYQKVTLDDRFDDSPDMLAILAAYQEQLKTIGLEGLGLKPIVHPSGSEYVGSEKCGECHTKAYGKWQMTPHSQATEHLIHPPERSEIARHFDPECLSCHVTGWNPQKFFPYSSGYLSLEKTPKLVGSGCENCHGPGSAHVAAESGEGKPSTEMIAQLRAAMRLPLSKAESKCMECHDIDNSPDFHDTGAFEKYWKAIEHKGLD